MRGRRIWVDISPWPEGPGKSAFKYVMSWWWAITDVPLIMGLGSCKMGIYGAPLGLFLIWAAVRIKYRHYKKIFAVKNRKYLRLPFFLSFFYLVLFWLCLAAKEGSSRFMIAIVSIIFYPVMVGLSWKRAFQLESVLHKYYPWIANKIPAIPYVTLEDEDWRSEIMRRKAVYEEIQKLYETTENQIVKEAIEKEEAGEMCIVLIVEMAGLSLWSPIIFL